MKKKKYLITWYIQLQSCYIHEIKIICQSEHSANIMYDKLAKKDNTISIEVEELWRTPHTTESQLTTLTKS